MQLVLDQRHFAVYHGTVLASDVGESLVEGAGVRTTVRSTRPFLFSTFSCEAHMNWNQVEGYWTQFRGRVREYWGVVTHQPLEVMNGRRAQLVGILQRNYGAAEAHREAGIKLFETQSEAS